MKAVHRRLHGARVLLACAVLSLLAWAEAFADEIKAPGYVVTVWGASEGAPQDVGNMAQTVDGMIWLGTNNGLFRFDGHHFSEFNVAPESLHVSRQVRDVVPDPKGGLWVLYGDAVEVHLAADGRTVTVPAGLPTGGISGAFVHADGRTFVTAADSLYVLSEGRWVRCDASTWGLPSAPIDTVASSATGDMLAIAGESIYRLPQGAHRFVEVAKLAEPNMGGLLVADPGGHLWVTYRKYTEVPGIRMATQPHAVNTNHITTFDTRGTFWTVQQGCDGLCSASRESALADMRAGRRPTRASVIPAGNISALSLMLDASGDLWVGARQGIVRFRPTVTEPVTPFEKGLGWFGVLPATDGTTLVSTYTRGGYNKVGLVDGKHVDILADDTAVSALTRLPDGTAILAGDDALYRVSGKVLQVLSPRPDEGTTASTDPAQVVLPAGAGRFWVSLRDRGLFLVDDSDWRHVGAAEGFPALSPTSGTIDASGVTWFGFSDGTLAALAPGATSSPAIAHVPSIGAITAISPGEPFLVGGEVGFGVLKDHTFIPLELRRHGLLRGVTGMVRTARGDVWLNTAKGLIGLSVTDLEKAGGGLGDGLPFRIVTTADGMPGGAQQVRPLPTLHQGADGKLWIAGVSGLVTFRPEDLGRDFAASPSLLAMHDGNGSSLLAGGKLEPGQRSLDADIVGVSLTDSGFVDLRYRLLGVDTAWRYAADEAKVSYSDLPPGQLRLEIQARGPSGDWSPSLFSATVTSRPAFFETAWFAVLMVLLVAAAAIVGHRYRMAVVRRRDEETTQAKLRERDRIARELHDSMLQGMAGVMLRVVAWQRDRRAPDELRSAFKDVAGQLSGLILEARARVISLRSVASYRMPLSEALRMIGDDHGSANGAAFDVVVEGEETPFDDMTHLAALDILREAIHNAFRHAKASHIALVLRYGEATLAAEVKDNGQGLPEPVTAEGRRAGHWGMVTMRERAQEIGGRLSMETGPGGTTVTLVVPLPQGDGSRHAR